MGESISEVQIGRWLKSEGDWVAEGEDLVEIETEKASVQIPSPAAGFLQDITKHEEEFAAVGDVVAAIRPGEKPADDDANSSAGSTEKKSQTAAAAEATGKSRSSAPSSQSPPRRRAESSETSRGFVMPAARRLLEENGLQPSDVPATGPGGRLLKEDVVKFLEQRPSESKQPSDSASGGGATATQDRGSDSTGIAASRPAVSSSLVADPSQHRGEEVKPLSMLRRTIASRLVQAQQTAALLTTFNEIDMQPVMEIRKKYKEKFAERHGVKLGFMSFFAKAAVEALRRFPAVNAEIRDENVIYRNYQDIGIAIGGGKGLVVPVLRNVEHMSFAEIEGTIGDFAKQASENRLQPGDLIGGTFTISNGGIYGSLLSTPIVNPPQSGILGLHSIQERPVAINGQVVIRPMMYVALTYDHRIVDGREAVGFLKTIKDVIEDPARLFLEL